MSVVHVGLASTGRRDVHVCTAGPNWEAFGHSGAGGSMAFADPKARIAVGYVMNQMASNLNGDPRTLELLEALYGALGTPIEYKRDANGQPERGHIRSSVLGDIVPLHRPRL